VTDVFKQTHALLIVLVSLVLLGSARASGQSLVYRWVDADGVVHLSDAPPDQAEGVEVESLPAPDPDAVSTEFVVGPAEPRTLDADRAARPAATRGTQAAPEPEPDVTQMTLAELDERCETAREMLIGPQRQAAVEECSQNRLSSRTSCERYYADFGAAVFARSAITGEMIMVQQRMGQDLPECVAADNERTRRAQTRGGRRGSRD
jgi:hypothetical protein